MDALIDSLVDDRPLLQNAPLTAVLCQVQFPRQLGFSEELVRPIQEKLAHVFPRTSEDRAIELTIAGSADPKTAFTPTARQEQPIFRFSDASGAWRVTVSEGAASLETTEYAGMRDLLRRWASVSEAVGSALGIKLSERLGLRYVNQVERPRHEISALRKMLRAELTSIVDIDSSRTTNIQRCLSQATFRQPEGFETNLRYGITPSANDHETLTLLLDIDCYEKSSNSYDIDQQVRRLIEFSSAARDFFTTCFTDQARESFGPESDPNGRAP